MRWSLLLSLLVASPAFAAGEKSGHPSPVSDVSNNRVKATGSTTTRALKDRAADVVNVKDYGAVGDGVADDTSAFTAACAAAVAAKKPLWLGDAKLYLSSQAASISADGLTLVGSGELTLYSQIPVDFGMLVNNGAGDGQTVAQHFDTMRTSTLAAFPGAVIYSKYNGPIFTGKKLSGSGFTVIGYPAAASNSAFVQTTPTSYAIPGGWSQAFAELHDATFAYFGGDGLKTLGGLEVTTLRNVSVGWCMGACLRLTQTSGVNSPIEYVDIKGGAYVGGLQGNIRVEGFRKHLSFSDLLLNDPGQLGRLGTTSNSEAAVPKPIYLIAEPNTATPPPGGSWSNVAAGVVVERCYAENAQGVLKIDLQSTGFPVVRAVTLRRNTLIHDQAPNPPTTYAHIASFLGVTYDISTEQNFQPGNAGPYFYFETTGGYGAACKAITIGERHNDVGAAFDSYSPLSSQGARYVGARFTASVSADRGDANQTLTVATDAEVQRWATTLTQNRAVTLSTTGAVAGDHFRVVRTGLGAFTLDVGGLKTIASGTAAFVDVTFDGSAWVLTGYGAL
jgi:hypothetical protein